MYVSNKCGTFCKYHMRQLSKKENSNRSVLVVKNIWLLNIWLYLEIYRCDNKGTKMYAAIYISENDCTYAKKWRNTNASKTLILAFFSNNAN